MVAISFDPAPITPGPRLRVVPSPAAEARPDTGRITAILAALAAVIVAAALSYLALTPELTEPGTVPVADTGYIAQVGDTMWSIAQDQAPAGTASTYVERLVAVNGTSTVAPGQPIVLPRS